MDDKVDPKETKDPRVETTGVKVETTGVKTETTGVKTETAAVNAETPAAEETVRTEAVLGVDPNGRYRRFLKEVKE